MDENIAAAMSIITWSGSAKSEFMFALEKAKNDDFVSAQEHMKTGEEYFIKAHKHHHEMITKEAVDGVLELTLLLIHAEDQLMNADMAKILVTELIELYERGK